MPIKVDIVSGFLGAGKTMLIKKLLEEGVYGKSVVIIENEFGEVAIDGAYLRGTGITIKEIKSGCICCAVTGDFKEAVEKLVKEYDPKELIVEPSGVASLSEVLAVFKDRTFKEEMQLNRIITVIDPTHFDTYITNFGAFYKNQICHANTIVLSRTQMIDANKLLMIVEAIKKLNSKAQIITTPWKELKAYKELSIQGRNAKSIDKQDNTNVSIHEKVHTQAPTVNVLKEEMIRGLKEHRRRPISTLFKPQKAEEVFDSIGMEGLKLFKKDRLRTILEQFTNPQKYGEILRAKGIFEVEDGKWVEWDYVYGTYEIRETKAYTEGVLCIIGKGLQKEALKKLFDYR